jgi:hypothetical protein
MWPTTTPSVSSAAGYVTHQNELAGLEVEIFAERDCKLEEPEQRGLILNGSPTPA